MSDRIKKIKIKQSDGTFSDYIPIGADAKNIDTTRGESVQSVIDKTARYYNSIAEMKLDDDIQVGDTCVTLGYYEVNDGGSGTYKIVDDSSLEDDGGSVHELNNGLKAQLIIKNNQINVKQFGAYGDGEHDDSNYLTNDSMKYILDKGTFVLDKSSILNNLNNISGTGSFKFKDYNYNKNNGIVPVDKINDKIYTSMNLPSDGITFMTSRINGNIIDPQIISTDNNLHGIGAVYKNVNEDLPDQFNLFLGKIRVCGYRNSTKSWEILKDNLLPANIRRYRLPWVGNISYEIEYTFDETKKMYKIPLTKEDFASNPDDDADGYVIHFWGNEYYLNDNDKSDIIQLACYCECSAETLTGEDITNKLLGVSAIDIIDSSGNTKQAGYSRNTSLNSYTTDLIFHTVKNIDYDLYNTNILYELFKRDIPLCKILYEDLEHETLNNISLVDNIKYYKKLKIFYSFKRSGYTENEYSIEIETNNNLIIHTILEAKCYYEDENNILNILTNTKEITINNQNVGNSNRLAIYEKLDSESNKLIQTAVYTGPNYISINRIVGYIL